MNLKKLTLIATSTCLFLLTWLIISSKTSLLNEPFSKMGNIENNYMLFVLGTSIILIIFTLILYELYTIKNIKINKTILIIPVLGIISVLIPYTESTSISKHLHTGTAMIVAGLILIAIYNYNKKINPENKIQKIVKSMPKITFIGTLTLFIATGISAIMQIFYIGMLLFWTNQTAFSKNKVKKK